MATVARGCGALRSLCDSQAARIGLFAALNGTDFIASARGCDAFGGGAVQAHCGICHSQGWSCILQVITVVTGETSELAFI